MSEQKNDVDVFVYVLALHGGRYYIGKTRDPKKRCADHFDGKGPFWTRIYKPEIVVERYISGADFTEENKTKEYMIRHGIYKVRGGPYSASVLDDGMVKVLRQQLWHAKDKCFGCGGNHFVKKCPQKAQVVEYCCRCGREGHWASGCMECTDVEGLLLESGIMRK